MGMWSVVSQILVCLGAFRVFGAPPGVPQSPTNLTLSYILSRAVGVTWSAYHDDDIHSFRLTVRPMTPRPLTSHTPSRVSSDLLGVTGGDQRTYEVHSLLPDTVYQIFIWAYNDNGGSDVSDPITFRTLEAGDDDDVASLHVHPGEVFIVIFLLIAWFCAIAWFLHKWGKIRITQSGHSTYKQTPKNLDKIKVVKRATDSVINRSYTPQVSKTMAARQKRIERMNTMPNIKVDIKDILAAENEDATKDTTKKRPHKQHAKFRAFSRTITAPVLEVEETSQV